MVNRAGPTSRTDLDTADLLNQMSRDVSKALWFVEVHLQGPTGGRTRTAQTGQPQSGTAGFQSATFGGSPNAQ